MLPIPDPAQAILITAGFILVVLAVAIRMDKKGLTPAEKKLFFALVAVPVIIVTLFVAGATVHKNNVSTTGGPIHWHADYQVWACGERLDLINPGFPSNKIGTPLFHEHNDDRIHVEGAVKDLRDIDLGSYFATIGGRLTDTQLVYPTDEGIIEVADGVACGDAPGELAVYVNGQRIEDPANYLYYPHAYVPPGDCIIIEFAPGLGETTSRLCESWSAKDWDYDNHEELREDSVPDYFTHRPGGEE